MFRVTVSVERQPHPSSHGPGFLQLSDVDRALRIAFVTAAAEFHYLTCQNRDHVVAKFLMGTISLSYVNFLWGSESFKMWATSIWTGQTPD